MRAYGASTSDVIDDVTRLYDVILVKSQSSKWSHSVTTTQIDCLCGQTLLSVSVTEVTTCVIFLLTWLLLVYTRDTKKVQWWCNLFDYEATLVSMFTITCSTICRRHDRRACSSISDQCVFHSFAVTIISMPTQIAVDVECCFYMCLSHSLRHWT